MGASNVQVIKTFDLAETWHYLALDAGPDGGTDRDDYALVDHDHSDWPTMQIPRNWFLGGLDHHGVVWYRREFEYERQPRRHATLRFDGVDYLADVYLNGAYLGRHEGYFEPFSFDVTEHLQEGRNALAVRVDSPFEPVGLDGWHLRKRLIKGVLNHHDCRPGSWEASGQSYNTGGIWNRVTLMTHGLTTVEQVLLRANLDADPPLLQGAVTVQNRGAGQVVRLRVVCTPDNHPDGGEYGDELAITLPAGASTHEFSLAVPDVSLWQPWDRGHPHLYRVALTLVPSSPTTRPTDSQPPDYATTFGFRTVAVDEDYNWTLNGERYFPRGSNYIASQWLSETLFPEVAQATAHPFRRPESNPHAPLSQSPSPWFERDVALMKGANLNTIRVHAHVLPPEFHTACDRAGILVWQDFPLQWGYRDDPAFHDEAERQMRAMVRLLYNHPSIVAWCCHNESPWDAEWMAEEAGGTYDPGHNQALDIRLEQAAKALDPTRYVHRNSGTGDGHAYPGWYGDHWRDYRTLPGAPFPTEYGAQGLPGRDSLIQMFSHLGPDAGHADLVRLKAWADIHHHHHRRLPLPKEVPADLLPALEAMETWCFHDFQPLETFADGRVSLGATLDDFITNSQAYQSWIIQYGTEMYRRHKYSKVTGVLQFMFVDPWPAITWAVLDYWRVPKSSYDALRRAMQPVLPSADLVREVPAGKPLQFSLCVVNDMQRAVPGAVCHWQILTEEDQGQEDLVDAGLCRFDLSPDAVTGGVAVNARALDTGQYRLVLELHSQQGERLGQNHYRFTVADEASD